MLRTELLEIIANGEHSGVEFKRDDLRPEQLAKEIVAMANFMGGMLLLGIEDDGTISGIQREGLEEWIMGSVFSAKIHPTILPFYEEVQVDDKRVAVVSFPQGVSKPYVVRDKGRDDVYVRVGSTSRLATREQQMQLYESGGMLRVEELPVSGSSLHSLSLERLKDYLTQVLADDNVPTDDDAWEQRLIGLGYMIYDATGHAVCTVAGMVLFGVSPRRFMRQAGIRLMVFRGEDKEYQASYDTALDGPLVGLWQVDGDGQRKLAETDAGLIEQFIERIIPYISEESEGIDDDFRRHREWHYPREAVREAVINALVHRDWTRPVDVEIVVYSDRLEVMSPGAMQNSMTIEKMLAGQRYPRNQLLTEALRDYGYVDARGMGVRRKIVPLLKEHSGKDPEFEATDDYVKTVLFR